MKHWRNNKEEQSSDAYNSIDVLAPIVLKNEPHSAYHCVEELRKALNHPNCYNIALTGVYGSGKTSVLETLLKEEGNKYNYMKISLSSLLLDEKEDQNYENGIESKLFQQILFKVSHGKTPKTRYSRSRIRHFSYKKAIGIASSCIFFFLSYIVVFEPKALQIATIYEIYKKIFYSEEIGHWVNIFGDILACIYMLIFIAIGLVQLIRCTYNISLKSIKANDVSLDFDIDKSAFKELLGEILYFFKAGGYNLVIFEDLDRIKNPQSIFLKFREINQLLNESDDFRKNGKKIKFVYAIRDDVFNEEIRTKFFDYMVPVVPVIDKFNAGDYLIKNYKNNGLENIDDKEISELGLFIGTTRDLINIMNEYKVYKHVLLEGSMSQKKMLASIIYKNIYPQDYSLFHEKKGYLYGVLSNKSTFLDLLIKDDINIKAQLDVQVRDIRDKIISIRKRILNRLKEDENVLRLIVDEASFSIDDVAEKDDLFNLFENDKFDNYKRGDEAGSIKYSFKFNDIVNVIDSDNSICASMEEYQLELGQKRNQLIECTNRLRLTNAKSIKDLIQEIGDGKKTQMLINNLCVSEFEKIGVEKEKLVPNEQVELIHALVKNGFIEEDIETYLTFSYPGSKSRTDFEFLHSVLQGVGKSYNYKLDHSEEVLKSLHIGNYSSKEILNFDLLEVLIKKNDEILLEAYFATIRKNLDFVVQYYMTGRNDDKFNKLLFNNWDNCVDNIINQLNEESNVLFELLFSVANQNCNLKNHEKSILNEKYSFLCERINSFDITKLTTFISFQKLNFSQMVSAHEKTKQLYDYVIRNRHFEINTHNLIVIYGDDFTIKSFTSILNGMPQVRNYLLENINIVIDLFPNTDIYEDVSAIIEMSGIEKITDEQFESFIKYQENVIQEINGINAERLTILFKYNKIVPKWKNINDYLEVGGDKNLIRDFILDNLNDLEDQEIDESEMVSLKQILVVNNEFLPIEAFKALLPLYYYVLEVEDITELNEERLQNIIENDNVDYTDETKVFFASKSPELFGIYLVHFFNEFQNDEDFDLFIMNKTGIFILNSDLTIEQKKYFIDRITNIPVDNEIEEFSRLICYYYSRIVVDENTNVEILINAMNVINDTYYWKQKIDIINNININILYNKEKEAALIETLGGGYLKLNSYRGIQYFDINDENRTLLYYLKSIGHFVKNIFEINGQYKVTFKNPRE